MPLLSELVEASLTVLGKINSLSLRQCMLAGLCLCQDPLVSPLILHDLSVYGVLSTCKEGMRIIQIRQAELCLK